MSENVMPGRDDSLIVDINEENEFYVSMRLNNSDESLLDTFNIDRDLLSNSILYKECETNIQRQITKNIFSVNKLNIQYIDKIDELIQIIKSKTGFVITNIQIGYALQNSIDFMSLSLNNTSSTASAMLYQTGVIKDVSVFIDPYMSWDDNRLAIIEDNFYNYHIDTSINIIINKMSKTKKIKYYTLINEVSSNIIQLNTIK